MQAYVTDCAREKQVEEEVSDEKNEILERQLLVDGMSSDDFLKAMGDVKPIQVEKRVNLDIHNASHKKNLLE